MKKAILIVFSLFSLHVMGQEAKLDTRLKPQVVQQKPDVKILYDAKTVYSEYHHHVATTWILNANTKVTTSKLILNFSNIKNINIDKKNKSIIVDYQIEKPEIIDLYKLAKKHCKVAHKDILFSIDGEWLKQPDSVFIAIDAIKQVRVVDSKNYPYLSDKKNQLTLIAITTLNPPKKEVNDGKPQIYIR